jgi:hypothetical protein
LKRASNWQRIPRKIQHLLVTHFKENCPNCKILAKYWPKIEVMLKSGKFFLVFFSWIINDFQKHKLIWLAAIF